MKNFCNLDGKRTPLVSAIQNIKTLCLSVRFCSRQILQGNSKGEVLQESVGYEDLKTGFVQDTCAVLKTSHRSDMYMSYCPSRTLNMIYPYDFVCE